VDKKPEELLPMSPATTHSPFSRSRTMHFDITPANFRGEKEKLEDNYEILETVGLGTFGKVNRIRHKTTNETRAVKTLSKSQCQNEKEFSEEIKILQKLVFSTLFNKN
jgi:serine/threonine protein kinase